MKKTRGFTLIELMVVVIVIAILAAIALPSYLNQTRKSRRIAVEAAMQQIALAQERFRADCNTYATSFGFACTPSPPTFATAASFYSSSYYQLAIPAAGATAYTITATAQATGKQNRDTASGTSCATLYYTFGVDAAVNTACTVTTAAGAVTKCPAACWAQ